MLKEAADGSSGVGSESKGAFKAGKVHGWGPLAPGAFVAYQTRPQGRESKQLTIGRVLINHREDQKVTLQPHRGKWGLVRVLHVPQFQTRNGYSDLPSASLAKEIILYAALVKQVELLQGGELTHGDARSLSKGGWGLLLDQAETVRYLSVNRSASCLSS